MSTPAYTYRISSTCPVCKSHDKLAHNFCDHPYCPDERTSATGINKSLLAVITRVAEDRDALRTRAETAEREQTETQRELSRTVGIARTALAQQERAEAAEARCAAQAQEIERLRARITNTEAE